ncbi:hypothetical protein [Brochothrix thermosphacta]|uniref:hypothetical protein n=1 Tax=Brochothrix thermosphacta TaxID=2756 RepID=UPI001C406029|nr:hypothetical protein [Brochothrix thermosphacta]
MLAIVGISKYIAEGKIALGSKMSREQNCDRGKITLVKYHHSIKGGTDMALNGVTKRNGMHIIIQHYLQTRIRLGMGDMYYTHGAVPIHLPRPFDDIDDTEDKQTFNQWCEVIDKYYKALAVNNSHQPLQTAEIRKQLFTLRFIYLINDSKVAEIMGLNGGTYSRHKKPVVDTFLEVVGVSDETVARLATYIS